MSEHAFAPTVNLDRYALSPEGSSATIAKGDRIRITGWRGGELVVEVTDVDEHGQMTVRKIDS